MPAGRILSVNTVLLPECSMHFNKSKLVSLPFAFCSYLFPAFPLAYLLFIYFLSCLMRLPSASMLFPFHTYYYFGNIQMYLNIIIESYSAKSFSQFT